MFVRIPVKHFAEIQETKNGPYGKQKVGFHLHRFIGKEHREEKHETGHQHDKEPCETGDSFHQTAFRLRAFVCRCGNKTVYNDGPNGGHVHDPADGGPSHKRNNQRNQDSKQHRFGRIPFLIQGCKSLRHHFIFCQRIEQTAERNNVTE